MRIITIILAAVLAAGCTIPAEEAAAPPPVAGAEAQPSGEHTDVETTTRAKRWVTVATLSGSGIKNGDSFHLTGADARLVTTAKPTWDGGFVLAVYVMDDGTDLQTDGGIPEATPAEPGRDITTLRKMPGDYYLAVNGANVRWSVKVQEKR